MFDALSSVTDFLGDGLQSLLETILNATVFRIFYYIERTLCWIINILGQLFEVFSGLEKVSYGEDDMYLINVFFNNSMIRNIYIAMAAIGMVLTVGFTIWALIKKIFDISDKEQRSIGQILTASLRSIVLIVGLTMIINAVVYGTNILMQQVNFIFNNASHLDEPDEKVFTQEEYAAMGRVLITIGNYSVVNTSNNRYNLNACFNAIRPDMYYLERHNVFAYDYYEPDKDGNATESWQSVLSRIAKSCNLNKEVSIDEYHEEINTSLTYAIDYLTNNRIVTPVPKATKKYESESSVHLDRMVFLLGTLNAAHNDEYNKKPAFDDALRGPYYYQTDRTIYDIDQVTDDFDIGFKTDYILVWLSAVAIIFDLVVIIMNCIARIFNMIFLYIIAPPIIAASPFDQGQKFKQWGIAFLVQSLSVFGTIISMRLLLIYLPIVMDPDLVFFADSKYMNAFAKFVMVYAGFEVAKKATGLLTGILADSAGWQSISAGDMSTSASKAIGTAVGAGKSLAGTATRAGMWTGGKALGVAGFAARPLTNRIAHPFKQAYNAWSKYGTKGQQDRNEKQIEDKISFGKAQENYLREHPEDSKYLLGPGGNNNNDNNNNNNHNNNNNNNNNPNQPPNQQNNHNGGDGNNNDRDNNLFNPPPGHYHPHDDIVGANNAPGHGAHNLREQMGFDQPPDNNNGPGQPPQLRRRAGSVGGNPNPYRRNN